MAKKEITKRDFLRITRKTLVKLADADVIVRQEWRDYYQAYVDLYHIKGVRYNRDRVQNNTPPSDDTIIEQMDRLDRCRRRLRVSLDIFNQYKKAIRRLCEQDRVIISYAYFTGRGRDWAKEYSKDFIVDIRTAYRRLDHAIFELARMIYQI